MLIQSSNRPFLRNRILNTLSRADLSFVAPLLHRVTLKERAILQETRRPVEYISFIESGLVSLRATATGCFFDVAIVGIHGMVGVSALLGVRASAYQSVVVVPGNALRIRADELQGVIQEHPRIREHLLQDAHCFMIHSSQAAVCGIHHPLEQRIASWFCLASDALESEIIPITHDHLSTILGCDRAAVTKTLKRFEQDGLIQKKRGILQIRARELLQKRACCCYGILAKARTWMGAPAIDSWLLSDASSERKLLKQGFDPNL